MGCCWCSVRHVVLTAASCQIAPTAAFIATGAIMVQPGQCLTCAWRPGRCQLSDDDLTCYPYDVLSCLVDCLDELANAVASNDCC